MTGYESKRAMAQDKLDGMEREALKLALEALLDIINGSRIDSVGNRNDDGLIDHNGHHDFKKRIKAANDAITAAREALAQPAQEPVAWMQSDEVHISLWKDDYHTIPLYTTPPQRTWVGLTDEETIAIELGLRIPTGYRDAYDLSLRDFAKAIEAKLKEMNNG